MADNISKTPETLKAAFIKELETKQCFCDGFSHQFVHAIDAVNFWIYCGLHYPYRVVQHANQDNRITFDKAFAMAILHDLTKNEPNSKPKFYGLLKARFIKELQDNQFTCVGFSHLFLSAKKAIEFWTACCLGYPYSLVEKDGHFKIEFSKTFGCSILAALQDDQPVKKSCSVNQAAIPSPVLTPKSAVKDIRKANEEDQHTASDPSDISSRSNGSNDIGGVADVLVLKRRLLAELQAFDAAKGKDRDFEFSHKFSSMADAEIFGFYCEVLGPMSICVGKHCVLECPNSKISQVIEILNPAVKLTPEPVQTTECSSSRTFADLCILKQKMLQELQAHDWNNDNLKGFTFLPTFKNFYDATFFAEFCDIKSDVSFVTHPMTRTTLIKCYQKNVDCILKKLRMPTDQIPSHDVQHLKQTLLYDLSRHVHQGNKDTFQFYCGFSSLSRAVSFADAVDILTDVFYGQGSSKVHICCLRNDVKPLIKKLSPVPDAMKEPAENMVEKLKEVPDAMKKPAENMVEKLKEEVLDDFDYDELCELKQKLLHELQTHDWKKTGNEFFVFSPVFKNWTNAFLFIVFCGIEYNVTLKSCSVENTTQLKCREQKADTILKKLQEPNATLYQHEVDVLKRKMLDELRVFHAKAHVTFVFSHEFDSLAQAAFFADACSITSETMYVCCAHSAVQIKCRAIEVNGLIEKLSGSIAKDEDPHVVPISDLNETKAEPTASVTTPEPTEAIVEAVKEPDFYALKKLLLQELQAWKSVGTFHFSHKFEKHAQAVEFVRAHCDIYEESHYTHFGDYVTVTFFPATFKQAVEKLSLFFGVVNPTESEEFEALRQRLLRELLVLNWKNELWIEFDHEFKSRPQAVAFTKLYNIHKYAGHVDRHDDNGNFKSTKLLLARCNYMLIIDELKREKAVESKMEQPCDDQTAPPCPTNTTMSDANWQVLQDWIMSAEKQDIVNAFAKLLKKQ
jgi:hypothetical protein